MIGQPAFVALALVALQISTAVGEFQERSFSGFNREYTENHFFDYGVRRSHFPRDITVMEKTDYYIRGSLQNISAEFIELEYQDFTMVVILPDEGQDVDDVEKKLKESNFSQILARGDRTLTHLHLPKFELNSPFPIDKEHYRNWNSGTIYNDSNNSLGMDESSNTLIYVNRTGVKTLLPRFFHKGPIPEGHQNKYEGKEFLVNRPFLIIIRRYGEIILLARIIDPLDTEYYLQKEDALSIEISTPVILATPEYTTNEAERSSPALHEELTTPKYTYETTIKPLRLNPPRFNDETTYDRPRKESTTPSYRMTPTGRPASFNDRTTYDDPRKESTTPGYPMTSTGRLPSFNDRTTYDRPRKESTSPGYRRTPTGRPPSFNDRTTYDDPREESTTPGYPMTSTRPASAYDVHTIIREGGRDNESGFVNSNNFTNLISKSALGTHNTDSEFEGHVGLVTNIVKEALDMEKTKSGSVKGSPFIELIYRKFFNTNGTEGYKANSTSSGIESILRIFH